MPVPRWSESPAGRPPGRPGSAGGPGSPRLTESVRPVNRSEPRAGGPTAVGPAARARPGRRAAAEPGA
jgi:hypothetical protein